MSLLFFYEGNVAGFTGRKLFYLTEQSHKWIFYFEFQPINFSQGSRPNPRSGAKLLLYRLIIIDRDIVGRNPAG